MRTGWLHPGALPETRKIHQNQKFYLSVVPCPLINTAQWSKNLPYGSITLKTSKNHTVKDVFQRK